MNNQYDQLILKYSREFQVLPEFVKGIIEIESTFNPLARGDDANKVGGTRKFKPPDGRFCSYGLGQANWCSGTAQSYWKVSSYKDLFKPEVAVAGVARYLRYQLDRYGNNYKKAISAYNAGHFTKSNSDYVAIVFGNASRYAGDFRPTGNNTTQFNVKPESGKVESSPFIMIAFGLAALFILISIFKDD